MEEDMCSILLSIKPDYVEKIFSGDKKYEFRTRISKEPVDKIYIRYCSSKKSCWRGYCRSNH